MLAPSRLQDVEASSKHTVHTGGRSPAWEDYNWNRNVTAPVSRILRPTGMPLLLPASMTFPPYLINNRCPPRPIPVPDHPDIIPFTQKQSQEKSVRCRTLFCLNPFQVSGKQIPPVQSASVQLLDAKQALQTLRYRTPIWSSIFALIRSVVFPQISHFPRAGPFPARYSA